MSEDFGYIVNAVRDTCISRAEKDGSYAVAIALFEIATALNMLGFGHTHHPVAIEGHTMKMMDSLSSLSSSLDSISEALSSIARAIEEKELTNA
jgi:hypothetical protein